MKTPAPYFVVVVIVLACCQLANGQSVQSRFFQISKANGLSSNQVNCLLEDHQGFLWVGTDNGLNRCDGQTVRVLRHNANDPHSLTSNHVISFAETGDGKIWAATNDGTLHEVTPLTMQAKAYPLTGPAVGVPIQRLLNEGDSVIWAATESGIGRFIRKQRKWEFWSSSGWFPSSLPTNFRNVNSLAHDPSNPNRLWVGARGGLVIFDKKTGEHRLAQVPEKQRRNVRGLFDQHFAKDGKLWLTGNNYNIVRYDIETGTVANFQTDTTYRLSLRAILPKGKQGFWVASVLYGLGVFDAGTGQFQFDVLPTEAKSVSGLDNVWALAQSKSGLIWVGTDAGVFGFRPMEGQLRHVHLTPEGTAVPNFFFCQTLHTLPNGQMLMGENSGSGIWLLDQAGKVLRRTTPFPKHWLGKYPWFTVYDIEAIPGSRNLIVAANTGLFELDWASFSLKPYITKPSIQGRFHRIILDEKRGCYWLHGSQPYQLVRLNAADRSASIYPNTEDGLKVKRIVGISLAPGGKVWVCGEPVLMCFDPEAEQFDIISTAIGQPNSPASAFVNSIATDHNGRIWLAYEGAGLDSYDPVSNQWCNFRLDDGLPTEKLLMLRKDATGTIWIATSNGLVRLEPSTNKFTVFDETDGLLEPNLGKLWRYSLEPQANGQLFIGGLGYFSLLTVSQPKGPASSNGRLKLTGLQIFDEEKFAEKTNDPTGLHFSWMENFFTLQFANLDWHGYPGTGFEYMLSDFEGNWKFAQQGRAPYTNVPPGRYVFKARLAGSDTVGLEIPVWVAAPFWKTWWFRIGLLLGLMGVVMAVYRWRVAQVQQQEAIKTDFARRLAEVEMRALRSQMNPHFIFNSLNSIKSFIARNERREATDYLSKFAHLIRLILSNSKSHTISLEQELEALRIYMELEAVRFGGKFGSSIDVSPEVKTEAVQVPPLILQPFVENAIWHGLMHKEGPGQLEVRIFRGGSALQIEVEDNGIGRAQAAQLNSKGALRQRSFGLEITKDRLEQLYGSQAKLVIEDKTDATGQPTGTLVRLVLP